MHNLQDTTAITQSAFTFSSICAVNSEVSWLTRFQASSLHARPKHFHLLRMAPLTYQDLNGFTSVRITLLIHARDHSQTEALLGQKLHENSTKLRTNCPDCFRLQLDWYKTSSMRDCKIRKLFSTGNMPIKDSRRAHCFQVPKKVLSPL